MAKNSNLDPTFDSANTAWSRREIFEFLSVKTSLLVSSYMCSNLLSSTGLLSLNFFAPYAVSKFGVEAFSDALRREMNPWEIQVSIMEPGAFKTHMNNSNVREIQLKQGWDDLNDDLKEEYGENYLEKSRLTVHFL